MENLVLYPNQNNIPTKKPEARNGRFQQPNLKACSVLVASIYEDRFFYDLNIMATGLKFKHFKLELNGRDLTISAKKPFGKDDFLDFFKGKFPLNAFSRTFRLPRDVKLDHIECSWVEGVFKICMPKTPPRHRS